MKPLILTIFLSLNFSVYSQLSSKLYFMGCTPTENLSNLDTMNSNIYSLEHDSIIIAKQIVCYENQVCNDIKYLNNNSLIIFIESREMLDSKIMVVVPFSNIENTKYFNLGQVNISAVGWLYKENKNEAISVIIRCYDYSIKDNKILRVNIETGKQDDVTTLVLKDNFFSEGSRTILSDWTTLSIYKEDGRYYIFPIQLGKKPIEIQALPIFSKLPTEFVVSVNTERFLIYTKNDSVINKKEELGQLGLIIYDKEIEKWNEFTIKGDLSSNVLFDNWLCGEVINYYSNKECLKTPGKKMRSQKYRETGEPIDLYFEKENIYCPGVLFLLNLKTFKYIEWKALENGKPQGDSEILLLQDEIVYYRINDKIYKAPIIKGEKLGEAVLLVKDPRVPDIHWAFISGI